MNAERSCAVKTRLPNGTVLKSISHTEQGQ